jgi:hypothetical protein
MSSTNQSPAAAGAREYFLQDSRSLTGDNLMFWGAKGGYTSNLAEAEVFTEEAAFGQNACRSEDIPWPVDYLALRTRLVVDMQNIKASDIGAQYADCDQFYLQEPGYVGNDILLAARDGGQTNDLGFARVFTKAEMLAGPLQGRKAIPWPTLYLDNKSRPTVDVHKVNIKKALKGVTHQLKKERKYVERYKCHGCGIFMTMVNYYTTACRCGAENRP